jgi:murein DD-endopeptidase MepM/ murein hydrolase activator NlpD
LTDQTQDFERTLRSFTKEVKRIDRTTGVKTTGSTRKRRIFKVVIAVFAALQILFIAFPPFTYPVQGTVTSGYMIRQKPDRTMPSVEIHKGIDISASRGTKVRTAAPGRIIETGWSETAGNYVLVRHVLGFSTYYAHLDTVSARKGHYRILKSLPVGTVGSSGRSTGNHLHLEVRFLGWRLPPGVFLIYHTMRRSLIGV